MRKLKRAVNQLIFAGTSGLADHDTRKRICVGINIMCLWVIIINATAGMISYAVTREQSLLFGISVEMGIATLPIVLNNRGKFVSSSILFFSIISLATGYFSCLLGRTVESQLMILYLIGVAIFLFETLGAQIVSVSLSIILLIFLEWNFKTAFIRPMSIEPGVAMFMRCAVYGVVIFLVLVTFILYKKNSTVLLKRLQQYNKKVEADLVQEEQNNRIKDRFISNATHEMKVSFHSIFAIINILYRLEKKTEVKNLKQCLDDLRAACGISKSIIDNILEYEKHEAGMSVIIRDQLVDVRVATTNMIDIYRYLADERNVQIELSFSENVPRHILIDELILRHIITNLLHNAIKFTRNGTSIGIRMDLSDDRISIIVEDQGEGISEHQVASIFEPFITRNPEGLGLGLYIVRQMASSLNGEVKVLKTTGAGTIFQVLLPNRKLPESVTQYQTIGHSN